MDALIVFLLIEIIGVIALGSWSAVNWKYISNKGDNFIIIISVFMPMFNLIFGLAFWLSDLTVKEIKK